MKFEIKYDKMSKSGRYRRFQIQDNAFEIVGTLYLPCTLYAESEVTEFTCRVKPKEEGEENEANKG